MENIIKVPAIQNKLKLAEKQKVPIYIKGAVGFGKTTAVKYYYRNKSVIKLNGLSGALSEINSIKRIQKSTIIIDDISWITDNNSKKYINNLINNNDNHLVLIGRAKVPEWLNESLMAKNFIMADERDLIFDKTLIKELFTSNDVEASDSDIVEIENDSKGYPLVIKILAYKLQNNKPYSEVIREDARMQMFRYYNSALYERWSVRLRKFVMAMANFDYFNVEFAEMVTMLGNVSEIIEEAFRVGNFLVKHENGIYEMRYVLKRYLLWKQILEDDKEDLNNIYSHAAIYYEIHEEIEKALKYYKLVNDSLSISRLLIKNAEKHPGTAHYIETKDYYLNLPEEKIKKSPVLMAGVCMIYSMMMQIEKSEEWYHALNKYSANAVKGSSEKKEAVRRIIYLDIALPHRGIIRMIDIFRDVALLLLNRNISLPEFSVTSNLPSVLNGGKDFYEWTKRDKEIAKLLNKPVEMILGKYGVGTINIALAESLFEKGQSDLYEVLTLLNSGYTEADTGGKIEMCFAAVGNICRVHVNQNQIEVAKMQLEQFEKKAKINNATMLMPNIKAMRNWFNLLQGDKELVNKWVDNEAPNEHMEFYVLDRYRYLIKVRSYIALERYEEAIQLIERLSVYFDKYKRLYMGIENQIIKSIVQYRTRYGNWKDTFSKVLKKIEEYHFVFVLAKEGAAVYPLLKDIAASCNISDEFKMEIEKAVQKMLLQYPNYLKNKSDVLEELTETETKILNLYCDGVDTKEICEIIYITYNTLKYHNKNIYRKLRVKNRFEAIKKAKELGL